MIVLREKAAALEKTAGVFWFSLCLSRACLGKMIVFIYKWLKYRFYIQMASVFWFPHRQSDGCFARWLGSADVQPPASLAHAPAPPSGCHGLSMTQLQAFLPTLLRRPRARG
jgi:hypothetical protein